MKRLKSFIGADRPAESVFNISGLKEVNYFGLSGGLINKGHHLSVILSAVRRYNPQHLIVFIGGNDLDSRDLDYSSECLLSKLTAFLTQLKRGFNLKTVTVLSFIPRSLTRNINNITYNQRVKEANALLKDYCLSHSLVFWRLRGFAESRDPILCDGVHLNSLGYHKLCRQIRGVLLAQHRQGPSSAAKQH